MHIISFTVSSARGVTLKCTLPGPWIEYSVRLPVLESKSIMFLERGGPQLRPKLLNDMRVVVLSKRVLTASKSIELWAKIPQYMNVALKKP